MSDEIPPADQPRTQPPEVPFDGRIERFSGRMDSYIPDGDARPCPECGSERVDGWMDEGAVTFRFRCVECSNVYKREGEE
jgi:hypothetical protein